MSKRYLPTLLLLVAAGCGPGDAVKLEGWIVESDANLPSAVVMRDRPGSAPPGAPIADGWVELWNEEHNQLVGRSEANGAFFRLAAAESAEAPVLCVVRAGAPGREAVQQEVRLRAGANWADVRLSSEQAVFIRYSIPAANESSRIVEANYQGPSLDNQTLAVIIAVDQRTAQEYPTVRELLTRAIAAEFERQDARSQIKGLRIVDPKTVLDYQDRNPRWDETGKAQLGKALGADLTLSVELSEFRTREPGALNLLQGNSAANASLYKTAGSEPGKRLYKTDAFRVTYPANTPGGVPGLDDSLIRQETIRKLAEKVAQRFYRHRE